MSEENLVYLKGELQPASQAHIAIYDAAVVLGATVTDLARTFALVLHLTQFGFTMLLGGTFLVLEGLSLRALVQQAPPDEDAAGGEVHPDGRESGGRPGGDVLRLSCSKCARRAL